jgi:mono/diheme cytochrome c family protein
MKTTFDTARGREGEGATRLVGSRLSASWRLGALAFIVIAFCFVPFALRPASAHEPITTKVRFNKEVIRVLQRSCLGCHRPGGIAMSLATYEEARPWAKAIKEELLEKRMPPWHAAKGYGEFRNAPSLTQREVDLIVNWVEGGAPKGDEKDLPAAPLFSNDWQLGKPDLTLKPVSESKIAGDADEYRSFVTGNLKEDRWLTAVDLRPGNGSVVHCANIYLLFKNSPMPGASMMQIKSDELGPAQPLEDLRNAWVLTTWIPGQKTVALDDGVAQLLPAGSHIGVRIHYRGSGEATNDLTAVGLYFGKAPPTKQIHGLTIEGADSLIPVGSEPHQRKASFTVRTDSDLIAIRARVHPIMVSLQGTAYRPDGSEEVLIWTRGYQFDWEPTYYFKTPVPLPKGTRVEVIAYFDNSDDNQNNPNNPPKPVRWSELTTDPWCVFLLASTSASVSPATTR